MRWILRGIGDEEEDRLAQLQYGPVSGSPASEPQVVTVPAGSTRIEDRDRCFAPDLKIAAFPSELIKGRQPAPGLLVVVSLDFILELLFNRSEENTSEL